MGLSATERAAVTRARSTGNSLSPRWVELRVWELHAQEPKTMHGGQEVFLHPSMLEDGYAHSAPPDYVNREGYDVDRWAGTRLAAHGML